MYFLSIEAEVLHSFFLVSFSVMDSDGEFLLIEAADYLPPWADPETCGQRVSCQIEILFI